VWNVSFFFFFQAEDGIRDKLVTGVQTCALPISLGALKDPPFDTEYIYSTYILERAESEGVLIVNRPRGLRDMNEKVYTAWFPQRSEERRVGKEGRSGWWAAR